MVSQAIKYSGECGRSNSPSVLQITFYFGFGHLFVNQVHQSKRH